MHDEMKEYLIERIIEEVIEAFDMREDNGSTEWDCAKLRAINAVQEIMEREL